MDHRSESSNNRRHSGYGGSRGGRGGGRRDDRRDGGYRGDRREGGYRGDRREGGYRDDRRDGGYRDDRRGGGYRDDRREGGYRGDRRDDRRDDRREGGYRDDRRGGGYRGDRRDDRREGGYRDDRREGGYRDDRREGGYRGDRRDDRREGGYRGERRDDRREGGYRDDRRDDRRGGGYRDDRRDDRRGGRGPARGGHGKSNRGGAQAQRNPHSTIARSGFREGRISNRINEPSIPADIDPRELDPMVRQELRSLSKDNADATAKHLIMAALLLDTDIDKALAHARAAKDRAGRVSVAREMNGIVAYHAGEWKEAISELRAARRMSGGPGMIALLADCERGLGRPEKALAVAEEQDLSDIDAETRAELAMVLAGAHQDMGNQDAAVTTLEEALTIADIPEHSQLRLHYAYADALETVGRIDEARTWFARVEESDTDSLLDAPDRLRALDTAQSTDADAEGESEADADADTDADADAGAEAEAAQAAEEE